MLTFKKFNMENLKNMTDFELISEVKETSASGECLQELVARHSGIYMTMVHSYLPNSGSNGPSYKNELISDKNYFIYKAAMKYDETKNTKFSTYLGNETRWMCLNLYNKNKNKTMRETNLATLSQKDIITEDDIKLLKINKEMLDKIINLAEKSKDERVLKILKLRYIEAEGNKVTPWKKISDELNLSIQGCINIHNKGIKKIQKQLEKEI
jgi:RNA polymerase sigma factor (sigma-70 family)